MRGSERAGLRPSSPRGRHRRVPRHFEVDGIERLGHATGGIPSDRREPDLEESLGSGTGRMRVQERAPVGGASLQVGSPGEPPSDLRRAAASAGAGDAEQVGQGNRAYDAERPRGPGRYAHARLHAPRDPEQHDAGRKLGRSGGGITRASGDLDLGQLGAVDLAGPDDRIAEGDVNAIAGLSDGAHDGRGDAAGVRHDCSQERQRGRESRGPDQAVSIRSASSISMTGMSSTIG